MSVAQKEDLHYFIKKAQELMAEDIQTNYEYMQNYMDPFTGEVDVFFAFDRIKSRLEESYIDETDLYELGYKTKEELLEDILDNLE